MVRLLLESSDRVVPNEDPLRARKDFLDEFFNFFVVAVNDFIVVYEVLLAADMVNEFKPIFIEGSIFF